MKIASTSRSRYLRWWRMALIGAPVLSAMLWSAGCTMVYSEERRMLRYVKQFERCLADQKWKGAENFVTEDMKFYPWEGTDEWGMKEGWKTEEKHVGIDEFLNLVRRTKGTSGFHIHVLSVHEISETKYLLKVRFQSRSGDMTESINFFWTANIEVALFDKDWLITEIKSTSNLDRQRS